MNEREDLIYVLKQMHDNTQTIVMIAMLRRLLKITDKNFNAEMNPDHAMAYNDLQTGIEYILDTFS